MLKRCDLKKLVKFLIIVTLEEQMICGALQTLNEDAFEDVASSERPSPAGLPTGEMLAQQLAPIRESSEFGSPCDDGRNCNNHQKDFLIHMQNNITKPEDLPTVIIMPSGDIAYDDTRL